MGTMQNVSVGAGSVGVYVLGRGVWVCFQGHEMICSREKRGVLPCGLLL